MGAVYEGASVHFDSSILSMDPTGRQPVEADRVIDVGGQAVLPGLVNLHVHIQRRHLHRPNVGALFRQGARDIEGQNDPARFLWALKNAWQELREGTTTFRDTGSGGSLANTVRWAFASGSIGGPRLVSSGEAIAMTGGHGTHYKNLGALEADGPDGVRTAVRRQLALGADWIKLMASSGLAGMPDNEDPRACEYTVEEMAAGVAAAHSMRAKVCAHAFFPEAIRNAVNAGVDSIEHGQIVDEQTAQLMARTGTSYVPTGSGQAELARRERASGSPEVATIMEQHVVAPHLESIATAHAHGVQIGVGTDTLGQMVREIQLLHAAGLSTMECLLAATSVGAEVLGMENEIGSIRPGLAADILVVDGNPVDNLEDLSKVSRVFMGGHEVEDEWILGSLENDATMSELTPSRPLYRRHPLTSPED